MTVKPFEFGRGERAAGAVVLLHSSGGSSRQWGALVERLRQRRPAHAIDVHGHGARAPWPGPRALSLGDDAALVEPFLARGERVHLVGHSYGAAVAMKAAARHPHAVASLTVYEPVLFRWLFDAEAGSPASREVLAVADTIRKHLVRGDAWRAAGVFMNYWTGRGRWEALSATRREALAVRMRSVLAHFDALFCDTLGPADLRRIEAPVLVMSGARTVGSTRRLAELMRRALPGALHERFPAMDHMGPVTHPDAVNARILSFLEVSNALPVKAEQAA